MIEKWKVGKKNFTLPVFTRNGVQLCLKNGKMGTKTICPRQNRFRRFV